MRSTQLLRNIILTVLPPIIVSAVRRIRRLLPARSRLSNIDPTEYSTLTNPIEVPCQVECYLACRDQYIRPSDRVLDVGFGLGYGLHIMSAKASVLAGVDVDAESVNRALRIFEGHPLIKQVALYDGLKLPFSDNSFDVVTCVEVLEHVPDYKNLLLEMARVSRRVVFITTPNRRPENTNPDGSPMNYWHLREWSKEEMDAIFNELHLKCNWQFVEGVDHGPFSWTEAITEECSTLVPMIEKTPL